MNKQNSYVRKLFMPLLVIFILSFSSVSLGAAQQEVAITGKSMTIREALAQVEKTTDYTFSFNSSDPVYQTRKDVDLKGNINQVLSALFAGASIDYKVVGNEVVLKNSKAQGVTQNQVKKTIKGRVIFGEENAPAVGVNVWLKNSANGVITDIDGNFSITITEQGGVLVFSSIGMKSQEVVIGNQTTIDIALYPDTEMLDDVVVVAYGQQKKESVIGAITTVDISKLKTPNSKVSNLLAGRVPGIISMTRSGEPGAGTDFFIRGISSFGASKKPLVLVDGVERPLDLVDPEDIESFSMLKDATATAVYGVRGANGVLIINTKKGEEGKPKITVRADFGVVGPTKMPKMINSAQWAELYNEALGRKFYSDEIISYYKDGTDPDLYPNVDWIGSMYKDWSTQENVNVNISGGGSMVRYYVSGGFYNEGSIFKEDKSKLLDYDASTNYKKFHFRANLDINITPSTTLSLNMGTVFEKKLSPGRDNSDIWGYSFNTSPNAFPMKYSDGKASGPTSGTGFNPYNLMTNSGFKDEHWNNAQSVASLTQDFSDIITPGLKANVKYSFDAQNYNRVTREFTPAQYLATGRDEEGNLKYQQTAAGQEALSFDKGNAGSRRTYLEASVSYDNTFGDDHNVSALFLFNQSERYNTSPGVALESLAYKNQGISGRLSYTLKGRYIGEFNIGYNGSENFSPGSRFGVFPAGALGWIVSEESFWEPLKKTINLLKLRGSYGIVGDDNIGGNRRFIYEETIIRTDKVPSYDFNGPINWGYGMQIGDLANPNVGWEEVTKTNLGLELGFLKNSIRLQGDYFHEKRKGIFLQRNSIPGFAGISTMPYVNVGEMKNEGFELSLEADRKVGEVSLTAMANMTYARNTVLNNDQPDWAELYRNRRGQRHQQIFGYQAIGFFNDEEEIANSPTQFGATVRPGDVKYKDINGDGVVNENDEIPMGYASGIPEIVYGFGVTGQWKGFDLGVMFQGVGHISFMLSGTSIYPFSSGNLGRAAVNEDIYKHRWHEGNKQNAKYPRVSESSNNNNQKYSNVFLRDGSFLRLKNVELGYTLPKSLTSKSFINSARIYLTGSNLLTFSKFKLWDPERGGGQGAAYPPNRSISIGFQVNI